MSKFTIFHNPRCSKSRQALGLLQEQGVDPDIRLYLENPPTVAELSTILRSLGREPRELLRKGEAEYKALGLGDNALGDSELLAAMAKHPKLIERPIIIREDGAAVVGRPPENVLDLLG